MYIPFSCLLLNQQEEGNTLEQALALRTILWPIKLNTVGYLVKDMLL